MSYGIEAIDYYIPEGRIQNCDSLAKFEIDENFLEEKIGIISHSVKSSDEETSDLCVKAFERLQKNNTLDINEIDVIVVVTQNPDFSLPHTAAIVHKKLGFKPQCAAFDISLGCSGFVYSLSVLTAFMSANQMKKGLLFTADPYSKVVNPEDKNTSLIFGDAAAVTLISENAILTPLKFTFGTQGEHYESLIVNEGELSMNGRNIFNFAASEIPKDLIKNLELNQLNLDAIDLFLFHPGSRYIVDTLVKRCRIDSQKAYFPIRDYGNTVSSTIPIMLKEFLNTSGKNNIFITGFGVGLSWASTILKRVKT